MNSKYERIFKRCGFSVFEDRENGKVIYDISGEGVRFRCPADFFPERFIQFCLAFSAADELDKAAGDGKTSVGDMFTLQAQLFNREQTLYYLANRLVNAERDVNLETIYSLNGTVMFLLCETSVMISQDREGLHISRYTDYGGKYEIVCRSSDSILEDVQNACRNYDKENYYLSQSEAVRTGRRIRIPPDQLLIESEMIENYLWDLKDSLEDYAAEEAEEGK